jgi:hypothetical protein
MDNATGGRSRPSIQRVPGPRTLIPCENDTAASAGTEPVRAMVRSVGRWGGWDSNPRPADYEKYDPEHRAC